MNIGILDRKLTMILALVNIGRALCDLCLSKHVSLNLKERRRWNSRAVSGRKTNMHLPETDSKKKLETDRASQPFPMRLLRSNDGARFLF